MFGSPELPRKEKKNTKENDFFCVWLYWKKLNTIKIS